MTIVWHDGRWEVRDGLEVVVASFVTSNEAWQFKVTHESATRRLWRRLRKAA